MRTKKHLLCIATTLASAYLPVARGQITTFSTVATNGYATIDTNACSIAINNLTTVGNYQFIAYYNNTSQVMIGRRTVGTSTWQTFNSGYTGTTSDDHDIIAMAVDSAGYMHLSWDMHNNNLNYAISNAPVTGATLSSLPFTTQTATNAPTLFPFSNANTNEVTYPAFYNVPGSNNLLFIYRNGGAGGGSGNGNNYFDLYDPSAHTWTNNFVINGEQTSVNAYINNLVYTSNNQLLMSWTWRATPNWQTNSNIMFAQSPDNGVTWYQQGGTTPYALPIIQDTSLGGNANQVAQVIKAIPQNSSFINQTSMAVDASNNPLIATYYAPNWNVATNSGDPNRQYMLVYFDGTQWRTSQISKRTSDTFIDTGGSDVRDLGRPVVLTDSQGRVLVVTRSEDTAMGSYSSPSTPNNGIIIYYNTVASLDSASPAAWRTITVDSTNLGAWEPTYDPTQWANNRILSMLFQPVNLGSSSSTVQVIDWDEQAYFASLAINAWNLAGSGTWETAGNWNNGVPNANAAIAKFGTGLIPPSQDTAISINGAKTVGTILFDSPSFHYTITSGSAAGSIILNNSGSAATVTVSSGSHTIAVPLTLSSVGNSFSLASLSALTITGNISGTGGITQTGAGTLILAGTSNTYSGNTTVSGGILQVSSLSPNSSLILNGGTFASSFTRAAGFGTGQFQLISGALSAETAPVAVTLTNASIQWGSVTFNPATLTLNTTTAGFNLSLAANFDLNNAVRTISVGAQSASLTGTLSGTGGISKIGPGTLVLTASDNYSGATSISAGMLSITGALTNTNSITFNASGTGIIRVATTNGLGNAGINIASDGSGFGPTSSLQLTGGITLANAITLAQRNNPSAGIENIAGNNTLSGTITLAVGGGQAHIQTDGSGTLSLNGGLTTNATAVRNLYLQGDGTGQFNGIIADNPGNFGGKIIIHKENTAVWTLAGNNTYTGGTSVTAGALIFASASARPGADVLTINSSTINSNTDGGAVAIVGDVSHLTNYTAALKTAFNTGTWNGTASIMTTTGSATQGIGLMTGSTWIATHNSASGFAPGFTVSPNDILLRFTYMGDTDFSGTLNVDDYLALDNGYAKHLTGWANGDFNYDGTINAADYALIDAAYQSQSGTLADSLISLHTAEFGQTYIDQLAAINSSAVPEPASLALLGLGLLCTTRRNRRFMDRPNHPGTRAPLPSSPKCQ